MQTTCDGSAVDRYSLEPMRGAVNPGHVLAILLKTPGQLFAPVPDERLRRIWSILVILCVVTLSLFGLVIGWVSGADKIWTAMAKILMGTTGAVLITGPSLFLFNVLSGTERSFNQTVTQLLSMQAIIGVVLVGLIPVIWLFSQVKNETGFFGGLVVLSWILATCFGLWHIVKSAKVIGMKNRFFPVIWIGIYLLVCMQMATSLRPIIGSAETFLPVERKLFLEHWADSLRDDRW